MIRSIPPASAHLALRPVPAPPPTTGRPAATWARSRWRHCSRVKKLMDVRLLVALIHGPVEGVRFAGAVGNALRGVPMRRNATEGVPYSPEPDILTRLTYES